MVPSMVEVRANLIAETDCHCEELAMDIDKLTVDQDIVA